MTPAAMNANISIVVKICFFFSDGHITVPSAFFVYLLQKQIVAEMVSGISSSFLESMDPRSTLMFVQHMLIQ